MTEKHQELLAKTFGALITAYIETYQDPETVIQVCGVGIAQMLALARPDELDHHLDHVCEWLRRITPDMVRLQTEAGNNDV